MTRTPASTSIGKAGAGCLAFALALVGGGHRRPIRHSAAVARRANVVDHAHLHILRLRAWLRCDVRPHRTIQPGPSPLSSTSAAIPGADLSSAQFPASPLAILTGLVVGLAAAFIIGAIAVRLSEAYFVIITLLYASVLLLLANNLNKITGGNDGLSFNLQPFNLLGMRIDLYEPRTMYFLLAGVAVLFFLFTLMLSRSRLGLVLRSVGDNQNRVPFLGYNLYRYRLAAFVIAGFMTSVSGILYALRLHYVSTEFLSFRMSVMPIVWVLLGGRGTVIGPVIGVAIMTIFEYYVSAIVTNYLIIVGVLLILVMRWSPRGLVGYLQSLLGSRARRRLKTAPQGKEDA